MGDDEQLPVPEGEVAMEDSGDFDGEDEQDISEDAGNLEPDAGELLVDEEDQPDDDALDFALPDPPADLVAPDVDE